MTKRILWEGMLGGKPSRLVLADDTMVTVEPLTEGLLSNIASGVWGFAKAHPVLTTFVGISAYQAIKKQIAANQKKLQFYAKDGTERKSMQPVIDQMVKSGYKLVKQAYKGANGYEWHLEKK